MKMFQRIKRFYLKLTGKSGKVCPSEHKPVFFDKGTVEAIHATRPVALPTLEPIKPMDLDEYHKRLSQATKKSPARPTVPIQDRPVYRKAQGLPTRHEQRKVESRSANEPICITSDFYVGGLGNWLNGDAQSDEADTKSTEITSGEGGDFGGGGANGSF